MAKSNSVPKNASRFDPSLEKPIFQWSSPDHLVYKKSAAWYVAIIFIALLLGYILYTQKLWSGIGLVFTAVLVFMGMSGVKPKVVKCSVYSQGIVVDDKVYRYNDFKSFWITYIDIPKIKLQLIGMAAGQVVLPLQNENSDIDQIKLYLSKHLPQDENKGEDITDIINRFLRF